MPVYRKKDGKDTWHWCQNCLHWPTEGYKEAQRKPTSGKLCSQCTAKAKKGDCKK